MGTGDSLVGPCGDSRRPWPALRRRLGGDPRLSLPAAAQLRCSSPPAAKEARAAARAPAILGEARSSRLVQPSPPQQCSSSPAPAAHQACQAPGVGHSAPAALACSPRVPARLLPTNYARLLPRRRCPPAPHKRCPRRPSRGRQFSPWWPSRSGGAPAQPHPSMAAAGPRPAPTRSWPRSVPSCGGLAPPPPDPGRGRRGTARHPGVEQRDSQKIARA